MTAQIDQNTAYGVAKQLTLDAKGEEAFGRLSKTLRVVGRDLVDLGSDLISVPALKAESSVETVLTDLETLIGQIHDATLKARLARTRDTLVQLAVPQNKADLTTADLGSDGGLLQPAQQESVGVFLRVPAPLNKQFPKKRGTDDSPPHATMLYVGDCSQEQYQKVVDAARTVLKNVEPFDLELTDYGEFTNPEGMTIPHMVPRAAGEQSLEEIHKLLKQAIEDQGISCSHHEGPFKAHVTLDYVPEGETYKGDRPSGTCKIDSLEVWGAPGGNFGRAVIELGTGELLRTMASTKRGADVSVTLLSKAAVEEERTVFGIVLEPEVIDSQNDIYSEEEIRKTAYRFMERYQQFGYMHQELIPGIMPLESYLAPVDFEIGGQKVRKGTWLLRVRVLDDAIWQRVKSGELTGFSIGGSATRTPDTVKVAA